MIQATFSLLLLSIAVQAKVVVYEGSGEGCSTLFYTETFDISLTKDEPIDLTELDATTKCSVTDNDGRAMELSFGDISETVKALTVSLSFSKTKTGYWNSEKMTVSYNNSVDDMQMDAKFKPVSLISTSFAFACSLQSRTTVKAVNAARGESDDAETAKVTLDKYQIEVYKVKDDKFSSNVQCVNWISKGAWMGVFAGLLSIAVVVMSVLMLLSISTPDRFETSKSKCLLIPHEH